jgi:hypothetical protein
MNSFNPLIMCTSVIGHAWPAWQQNANEDALAFSQLSSPDGPRTSHDDGGIAHGYPLDVNRQKNYMPYNFDGTPIERGTSSSFP